MLAGGARPAGGADDAEIAGRVADHPRGPAQLVGAVVRHHREAQARGPGGDGRRADRLREDAALERPLAKGHRPPRVADDHRNDVGARLAGLEAVVVERLAQGRRVAPQLLDQAGSRAQDASAASAAPTDGGGGAVEKMNGRAVLTSSSSDLRARRRRRRRSCRAPCRACRRSRRPRRSGPPPRRRPARPGRARRCRGPRRPSGGSRGGGRASTSSPIGATSPSIEKTLSVTISAARPPALRSPHARCSVSRWR